LHHYFSHEIVLWERMVHIITIKNPKLEIRNSCLSAGRRGEN
jgi:hypothetical protein